MSDFRNDDDNRYDEEEMRNSDNRFDEGVSGSSIEEEDALMNMSAIAKLGNIITSPINALKAIRYKPTVLLAMVLVPLLPLLYYLLFWESFEIQMIQLLENQFRSMGMELTRDMLELQLKIMRWTTPIQGVVGVYFGALVSTIIYFAIGRLMKKEVTFKQTFSMIMHTALIANMIWVVHMVATLIFGESNIMAPFTSLSSLLPADMQGSPLATVLMSVEIVHLWYMAILYFGLIIVCRYSKKAAGITIAVTFIGGIAIALGSLMATGMVG